jgi:hypothetical protein
MATSVPVNNGYSDQHKKRGARSYSGRKTDIPIGYELVNANLIFIATICNITR